MKHLLWLFLAWSQLTLAEPVKFSDKLQATFHHERCLQCHQFNSVQNNGRAFNSHRSRYLCSQCHTFQVTGVGTGGWFAPEARMDFTSLSAKDTCQMIKRNFSGDGKRLVDHMLTDERVRWALESGMTPGGQRARVPGGYAQWEIDVKAWARDGLRCE